MNGNPHPTVKGLAPAVAAMCTLVAVSLAVAGVVVEEKPVSLLTRNLVMRNGKAFVPGSDLARALGGTGRYDPVRLKYEIRPGARGLLKVNPGALASLAPSARNVRGVTRLEGPDSGTGGQPNPNHVAAQSSFKLNLGGGDVMIEEEEHVMLRPGELGFSIELIGRLLGGQARFDPNKGGWVLPRGGPGSPLAFR